MPFKQEITLLKFKNLFYKVLIKKYMRKIY